MFCRAVIPVKRFLFHSRRHCHPCGSSSLQSGQRKTKAVPHAVPVTAVAPRRLLDGLFGREQRHAGGEREWRLPTFETYKCARTRTSVHSGAFLAKANLASEVFSSFILAVFFLFFFFLFTCIPSGRRVMEKRRFVAPYIALPRATSGCRSSCVRVVVSHTSIPLCRPFYRSDPFELLLPYVGAVRLKKTLTRTRRRSKMRSCFPNGTSCGKNSPITPRQRIIWRSTSSSATHFSAPSPIHRL